MDSNQWVIRYLEIRPIGWNKTQFFPSSYRVHTTIWMYHMDADKASREKAWGKLHKNAMSYTEQILEAAFYKTIAVRPPTTYL